MIDAVIREHSPGERWLWVIEQVDAEGNPTVGRDIPLAMIASWRELLGIDDPVEVLNAIIHIMDHGEPPHDLATGENVWTEAYQLLRLREQAREDEAVRAKAEQCTPGVVAERANKAAYDAVHIPVAGDECAMDLCRREARRKLGLPEPSKKCGAETRLDAPPVPEAMPQQLRRMSPAGGKAQALDVLAGEADYLLECAQGFLHGLTDQATDPLAPESEVAPEPVPALATPAETLKKYQEASK